MKRFTALAFVLGSLSLTGFVGCEEKTTNKDVQTSSGPDGTKKVTTEQTTEKTGDQKTDAPK